MALLVNLAQMVVPAAKKQLMELNAQFVNQDFNSMKINALDVPQTVLDATKTPKTVNLAD